MESIEAFIDRLPKVELHLHLVGSASVPTVLELRRRHPDGAGVPSSAAELAGIEQARPRFTEAFRDVFAAAIAAGLHSVPHAGEMSGPETIWEAVDGLRAERIGHGISCLADPDLVARLRADQIPLEVCPTSNVCTRQVASLAGHPLPRMLAGGLFVTLNSDDPPMFGTTLTQEYRRAASVLGLSRAQLAGLAASGVRASFLEPDAKQTLLAEIAATTSRPGSMAS